MNKYEILYIIRNDIEDDKKAAVVSKYEALVEKLGGKVESKDIWGTKKYAYQINKQNEGYYVLVNIECSVEAQNEIARQMGLDENVVRKMITRK